MRYGLYWPEQQKYKVELVWLKDFKEKRIMKQILLTLLIFFPFIVCIYSEQKTISFVQGTILNDTVKTISIGDTLL